MFWEKGQSLPVDSVGGSLTQADQEADPAVLVQHHMKNWRDLQVKWLQILAMDLNLGSLWHCSLSSLVRGPLGLKSLWILKKPSICVLLILFEAVFLCFIGIN